MIDLIINKFDDLLMLIASDEPDILIYTYWSYSQGIVTTINFSQAYVPYLDIQ